LPAVLWSLCRRRLLVGDDGQMHVLRHEAARCVPADVHAYAVSWR